MACEYELQFTVRLRYDAYSERDANLLNLKVRAQADRAALYALRKWNVRMDVDVGEPVFVRRYEVVGEEEL